MSNETVDHLNIHTLIGNTEHRGTAWHYRADLQSAESNHYPGPVPIADVRRPCPIAIGVPAYSVADTPLAALARGVDSRQMPKPPQAEGRHHTHIRLIG